MRSKATKSKSPLNTLVEKLDHLIETQRHKLSKEEFQKADDDFKRIWTFCALLFLAAAVYAASFAIVYVQYFSLFTVFGGTTPGMMLRGLRVVDFSGEEPSPRQFLLRAAGYMLSAGTFFLGFLWSQWDEDELTWHDRISHTYLSSANTVADSELTGVAHTH